MRSLFLHIGPSKTGTTSIQKFLSINREDLRSKGIIYPVRFLTKLDSHINLTRLGGRVVHIPMPVNFHHALAWSLSGRIPSPKPDFIWARLMEDLVESGERKVVLSAEGFSLLKENSIEYIRQQLTNYNVTVVFYLRNPVDRIVSAYAQYIKGWAKGIQFFESYLEFYDLYEREKNLLAWQNLFGRDKVKIFLFDEIVRAEGLIPHFMSLLDYNPECLSHLAKTENKSPSNSYLSLVRSLNRLHDKVEFSQRTAELVDQLRDKTIKHPNCRRSKVLRLIHKLIGSRRFIEEAEVQLLYHRLQKCWDEKLMLQVLGQNYFSWYKKHIFR